MAIVLIHCRIKPTDEAQADFFKFWTEAATIPDKSALVGEFLSAVAQPALQPLALRARTRFKKGTCV